MIDFCPRSDRSPFWVLSFLPHRKGPPAEIGAAESFASVALAAQWCLVAKGRMASCLTRQSRTHAYLVNPIRRRICRRNDERAGLNSLELALRGLQDDLQCSSRSLRKHAIYQHHHVQLERYSRPFHSAYGGPALTAHQVHVSAKKVSNRSDLQES